MTAPETTYTPYSPENLDWGSHLPALLACVAASKGPVLEVGCGHYSTPCLHALCGVLHRDLVTTEAWSNWLYHFRQFESEWHKVRKQNEILLSLSTGDRWGVVFIDDQADGRVERAEMFLDCAEFVLLHDCNFPCYKDDVDAMLERQKPNFHIYDKYPPHTLIMSREKHIPSFAL